jgi:hypothetical protein
MSFIGIGSPIPDIVNLPGQTGGEIEVTLDYPSASACDDASPFSPSEATPPGGTFAATPSGLNINASTGEVTPVGSTPQAYTISYTVSGVTSSFALTINAVQQSTFSYASSSFENSGTALPTLAGGTTSGGTFTSSSPSDLPVNSSTGELDLSNSVVGGPYTITYTTPGPCATSSTFQVSITAAYISTSSFTFDGVNDYFEIPYNSLNFNSGFSISAWFKWDGGTVGTSDNSRCIISRWSANSYFGILGRQFILRLTNATPNIQLLISPNGSVNTIYTGSTSISSGVWYHVAVTWDTNNYKVILNGNTGTPEINQNNTNAPFNTTTTPYLTIGATYSNSAPALKQFWSGLIDEVSIWDSALSSDAVTEIYNQGKPSNLNNNSAYSNLVNWWQLGENSSFDGTNWTVLDEKGSLNGTSANMGEDAIVNGVGTSGNGISDGMGGADNIIGDAPYSTANAVSYGMGVDAKSTDVPS